jgi:hypothetical protein
VNTEGSVNLTKDEAANSEIAHAASRLLRLYETRGIANRPYREWPDGNVVRPPATDYAGR